MAPACTTKFNIQKFCLQNIFVCFACTLEGTAVISTYTNRPCWWNSENVYQCSQSYPTCTLWTK